MTTPTTLLIDRSRFPAGDGDPMPELTTHREQMSDLIFGFEWVLAPLPRVHVGGNHFLYYNPQDPKDNVAPDVYIVLDVERRHREAYWAWEEGKVPDVVIEIVSPSTARVDRQDKPALYARIGVREYYIFDPFWRPGRRRPAAALQAYALENGVATPRLLVGGDRVFSPALGLEFRVVEGRLRIVNPATGLLVPTPAEEAVARRQAEVARRQADTARRQADTARRQADTARRQADTARRAAEAHAAEMRRDLDNALAEIARLRVRPEGDQ